MNTTSEPQPGPAQATEWQIIMERSSGAGTTRRFEFVADTSEFDLADFLSEPEEVVAEVLGTIDTRGIPGNCPKEKVRHLHLHDPQRLFRAILSDLIPWTPYGVEETAHMRPHSDAIPTGYWAGSKSGVKLWRLQPPIEIPSAGN
jgi:hypothetical protein